MITSEPKKKQLRKPSTKLYSGIIYEFDIYIRAALMIQSAYRGFVCRKRNLAKCATFVEYRTKVVKV
jgi:hypothetical protein